MANSIYTGWLIPEAERTRLLELFPAAYPDVVAHHITYAFGVPPETPAPPHTEGRVVGVADDGEGVQALVISINGHAARPDGSTFHCTWSLDRENGAKPVHSNRVIAEHGFDPCPPIRITLTPMQFDL